MKKQLRGFLSGVFITTLLFILCLSASALSGSTAIFVDPINIQVNGEIFQPKDAAGNAVPVFAYNGTTYAPLRALAEAYGLEVGYNAELNLATVNQKVTLSQSASGAPSLMEMYSAKTYYPYEVPSISSVMDVSPINVKDSSNEETPCYTYYYKNDIAILNYYKAVLLSNGYTVKDQPYLDGYFVYENGTRLMVVTSYGNSLWVNVYIH